MENNAIGNKRSNGNSPVQNPINKMQKTHQEVQMLAVPPQKNPNSTKFSTESLLIRDDKMNNIAKLRQQFLEEIKNIDSSLKESINTLKLKITEIKKKDDITTQKLKEENELICKQSKVIYDKEQENKILRLKVQELYEYQKEIVENLGDITTTINVYENLSNKLANQYDSLIMMQQNDHRLLKGKINKVTPDEKLCKELERINLNINKQEKEILKHRSEHDALHLEIEEIKQKKDKEHQKIGEVDKKIHDIESNRKILKQKHEQEKNELFGEIEKLKHDTNAKAKNVTQLEANLCEIKTKIQMTKDCRDKTEIKINSLHEEIKLLSKENEDLDQIQHKDQENNYKKLEEQLKNLRCELDYIKLQENKATHILQNKISEMYKKLKTYEDIEPKLQKIDLEIAKEENLNTQFINEYAKKISEITDKSKKHATETNEIKLRISQTERRSSESEKMIKLLEKEVFGLQKEYEIKLKEDKNDTEKMIKSISQYSLPNLFVADENEANEKLKNRRRLYTPTFADDDLEIDSLPIDEQFNHLTQSNSLSQSESSEKQKKFFKRSSTPQSQIKKENSARRGKNKKC